MNESAPQREFSDEMKNMLITVRHKKHRDPLHGWFAIHPQFGLLVEEPTKEGVEEKLKTLFKKKICKACEIMKAYDVIAFYNAEYTRTMGPPIRRRVPRHVLPSAFESPDVQPPFQPTYESPENMTFDGTASDYRNMRFK